MKNLFAGVVLLFVAVMVSCGQKEMSRFPDYTELEKDLYIKYFKQNTEGREISQGDVVVMDMKYTTEDDSVLFESQPGQPPITIQADSGKYTGDFMGVFIGMHEGDSASVLVNADSFFIKTAGMPQSPTFIDSGSVLKFTININKVQTMEEMQAEQDRKNAEMEAQEMEELNQYLANEGINAEPTASGMYFISKKKGSGKPAEAGKKVKVHYEGRLINGQYFDTSVEEVAKAQGLYDERRNYAPFEFTLGQGQVIPGWDEGIAMMREGGKATLIIPSNLGYGANPRPGGVIKPFNTLIFEVELLEVMD
jgi:FKBP-type peptidyl-prolyl cis-trans isomerase